MATLDDVERHLALLINPDFAGAARLYDGTSVTYLAGATGDRGPLVARAAPHPLLPAALTAAWTCIGAGVGEVVQVPWRAGALRVESPLARHVRMLAPGAAGD